MKSYHFYLMVFISLFFCEVLLSVEEKSPIEFERDIAPLFEKHCIHCHQTENKKGEFSFSTSKEFWESEHVEPGKPDESYLLDVIIPESKGEKPSMPKEKESLNDKEVSLIRRWIQEGAKWPEKIVIKEKSLADKSWWSLQPLASSTPPKSDGIPKSWSQNEIDKFVYARLSENKLTPSSQTDKHSLIRRVTYDLIGLPPTSEEINTFVNDSSSNAYEKVVDRLLASKHYGERWGRHWLDVIRFGESRGYERNEITNTAWPFRDYIIRSFNEDKPFNQMILEHLAGDIIGPDQPDVEIGTTFLVCGPYDDVGNQDAAQAAQIKANTVDDIIRATGETFLGVTVGCARCHDHKFDPILQKDYYSLYSTFKGVKHGSRFISTKKQREEFQGKMDPLKKLEASLQKEQAKLKNGIDKRSLSQEKEFQKKWVRPAIKRTGVEEVFKPVKVKHVRLVVEGLDTNPKVRNGCRIDEFEVWTTGKHSRNVALSKNGGKAEGSSRSAKDAKNAYSPSLTIDGKIGACWLGGSELVITFSKPELIDRVLFSSDRSGAAGMHSVGTFLSEYQIQVSQDKKKWTTVATSYDRKPVSSAHKKKRLYDVVIRPEDKKKLASFGKNIAKMKSDQLKIAPLPRWEAGYFVQDNNPVHIFLGGSPQRKGDVVFSSSLSMLEGVAPEYQLKEKTAEGERRLSLAKWIASEKNPLMARVIVNRIWQYHFGTGIVNTPNDFGYMGGRPSHPLLLDWLARKFIKEGMHFKPMHRLIVLSQTYQQSARHRKESAKIDSTARFLWRFPPKRLSGEEIRDSLLSLSGKLNKKMYGPGYRLYDYLQDNVATYIPLDQHGSHTYRRAIYHQNARAMRVDILSDFDCPDNIFSVARRTSTITPLQALTLMNHQFILDMAGFMAERLNSEAGKRNLDEVVKLAFILAYSRPAESNEVSESVKMIRKEGLRAFCRAILNSNEFIYLY
jgi:Protein of unknown function (DUF1553)/Protein of unknown function (DUF1549)/Planctomycete cytochrome C